MGDVFLTTPVHLDGIDLRRSVQAGAEGNLPAVRRPAGGIVAAFIFGQPDDFPTIAVDMDIVLKDAGLAEADDRLDFAIRGGAGQSFFGPGQVWQSASVIQKIELSEGAWELGGAPRGGWEAAVGSQVDLFRLGTILILGLIAAVISLTVNRQGRLAQAVAQRTRQIAAAQGELERNIQERTSELISSTLDLDPLLDQILAEIRPVLEYDTAQVFWLDAPGGLRQEPKPFGFRLYCRRQPPAVPSIWIG